MVPSPDKARQYAEAFVGTAREVYARELDFSLDSLARVDEIVESLRSGGRGAAANRLTLSAAACYVGEVMIRAAGGQWVADPENGAAKVRAGSVSAVPWNKVIKRLEDGPCDALHPYGVAFVEHARRAAAAPGPRSGLIARLRGWFGG